MFDGLAAPFLLLLFCGKICEVAVGEDIRLYAPFVMTGGAPCEWSLSITNRPAFPVQIAVFATVNGKYYWGEYAFPVNNVKMTNTLAAGAGRRFVYSLDETWMPSNKAPDTIEFLMIATNLTTGSQAANLYRAGTPYPMFDKPSVRGTPITRGDFPPQTGSTSLSSP